MKSKFQRKIWTLENKHYLKFYYSLFLYYSQENKKLMLVANGQGRDLTTNAFYHFVVILGKGHLKPKKFI